ncbi:hypothetical protein NP493_60g02008 [Ridgeia piscesae]|uniref:Uncharacterized protein n=1 Tax=Ridgeia piscesae TaxID=27915 RepID=A0AAD9PAF3_RIDPI|nr:hypothetical protein NP493_60g02008 [Ridgeia piscesae]
MTTECPSKQSCEVASIPLKTPLEAQKGDGSTAVGTPPTRKPINPNKVLKRKNTPASLPTVTKLSGEV